MGWSVANGLRCFGPRHGIATLVLLAIGDVSSAQNVRPGEERPKLPEFQTDAERARQRETLPKVPSFQPEVTEPGTALPRIELPQTLPGGARVRLREVRISGNTAIASERLQEIASHYVGQELSLAEIEQLRDDLTRAYLREGYVTSGAVVPPQDVTDGVLDVQIVEGRLGEIEVKTDGRFRESYLRSRLAQSAGPPVDVNELRERLLILQQDDRIRSIQAELVPTEQRGESLLRVAVEEKSGLFLTVAGNNYTTPALGEGTGEIGLGYRNVTGLGDAIFAEYDGSEGLNDVSGSYDIPFTVWDTRLELAGRGTWGEIVEKPFDDLGIKSRIQSYAVSLHQPIFRTVSSLVELYVRGEYRRSESFLLGDPFSFSIGPERGKAKLALLRGGVLWTRRTGDQVWAVRGQVTGGIDALGATRHSEHDVPDGRYIAGLLQLQWIARLPWFGLQLLARADGQLADDPLLGIEQFSIGGRHTVRCYRENQLVHDNGVVAGVELRVPVPLPPIGDWRPALALAPFYDVGYGKNNSRGAFDEGVSETLHSAGIGALVALAPGLDYEVYWGESLKDVPHGGEWSLQDDGVHMELRWTFQGWWGR